jgi:hypothetical protein
MNELLITKLVEIAQQKAWSDNEDFNPMDNSGGNYDDAYFGGSRDGETALARYILDSLGVSYVKKD